MALVEEYCEKNKMKYTYNLLLTISFSCVDAIVVLLVRECLGDVSLWLLRGKRMNTLE